MDWNKPPTKEFERLTNNTRYPLQWMTMLKCVLNDYYMDNPTLTHTLQDEKLEHFVHKIYYCWYQTMLQLVPNKFNTRR